MYPRKISRTILVVSSPNLKNVFLENFHRQYFIKYTFMIRQKFSDLNNLKEVNKKLKNFLKTGKFYNILQCPASKNGCKNVLKIWAHHCECVVAQRIRRCQQMFCLYSKWWEERALKEFICTMRQTITKIGTEFALGAIGISVYKWEENRISEDSLKEHVNELDYIYQLKENTVCLKCDATNKQSKSSSAICKCGRPDKPSNKSYDEWTTFIEQNDLIVWRRLHPSGNFEYKVYGSYNDVSAEDFLNVQIDIDYRRKWDTTAVILDVTETDPTPDSNSDIIYWEMLWPRLFVNRDYVFNRRYLVDKEKNIIYIISKSTEHPNCPKYPEKYRIEDYFSCMVIKPYTEMNKPGIEFSLTYFDNPGVNIPSSVTTWVSMRAMPDFLQRLRIATKTYKDYCLKEGVSKACEITKREAELAEKDKLEYCAFKSKEKVKSPDTKPCVQDKKAKPSCKLGMNSGNVNRNTDINSDLNSTPPSAAVQSKNSNFWKYLHPLYYFY